jgi:hypothetical protein
MNEGLKHKYNLTKADGRPVDPNGKYFILKINSHDPHHRKTCQAALAIYAEEIYKINSKLANDLTRLLGSVGSLQNNHKSTNKYLTEYEWEPGVKGHWHEYVGTEEWYDCDAYCCSCGQKYPFREYVEVHIKNQNLDLYSLDGFLWLLGKCKEQEWWESFWTSMSKNTMCTSLTFPTRVKDFLEGL